MCLRGELGYERGGDGVVCAYEETYREACQDQLERVGSEDREHLEHADGHYVDDEHGAPAYQVGQPAA